MSETETQEKNLEEEIVYEEKYVDIVAEEKI